MPVTEIKRPNYYEGQYLGAQDLAAALEYQRQQDQRHCLAAHTWGIGAGLDLNEQARTDGTDAVDIFIKPGYATDGFGRVIVVLEPYKVPEALFAQFKFEPGGRWIPVWLRYREEKTDPPRPGFAICGDLEQMYRVLETFRVVVGDLQTVQQRDQIFIAGKLVDAENIFTDASVPHQALPETNDAARWLIPLGSVRWLAPNPPATTVGHFVKSATDEDKAKAREGRRYVGVVAETVLAPASRLRIRDRNNPGPASNETTDLAGIEGSLRVDGGSHLRGIVTTDTFLNIDSTNQNDGTLFPGPGLTFGLLSLEGIASKRTAGGNQNGVDLYTKNATRLSITNDGNVGIGTTLPSHRFHVVADSAVGLLESTTTTAFLRLSTSEGPGNRVEITNRPGGRLSLWTAAGDVFNITKAGNVGIGTTDPAQRFHVLAPDVVGLLESTGTQASLRLSTAEGFDNRVEITNKPGGRLSLFTTPAGDVLNITKNGLVGIGTVSPARKVHVVGDCIRLENSNKSLDLRADGTSVDLHSETNNLYVRSSGPGGNNKLLLNPFLTDGSVGIGTETPFFKLDVAGGAHASAFLNSSDDRFKTNIRPLEDVIEKIQRIRGVTFDWNEEYAALGRATGKAEVGVLAHEIEAVFPELVSKWGDENYLAIDYGRITAVLIEAVKELAAKLEGLHGKIDLLGEPSSKAGKAPRK